MIYDDEGRLLVGRRIAIIWGVGRQRYMATLDALRAPPPRVKQIIAEELLKQVIDGQTTFRTANQVLGLLDELERRRASLRRLIYTLAMAAAFLALLILA